ncbi:MAG: cobalamin-binding protein [Cyanobacteria bacterium P01_D01_bin.105]
MDIEQNRQNLRIVSLIPSATEIVAALGYGDRLVGRSHECDYPASVEALPVCTEPKFDPVGTSEQIHQRVSDLLASALSVYRVKTDVLAQLRPTHIITQAQCEVCAVSLSDVEKAVSDLMAANLMSTVLTSTDTEPSPQEPATEHIQIVSLQPARLSDLWTDMATVAAALGKSQQATASAIDRLKSRLPSMTSGHITSELTTLATSAPGPKVACIEWTEPLMAAGNWVPELVALAGGIDCLGNAGTHSDWMSWEDLLAADPDIIVVLPCGYNLAQTRQATNALAAQSPWSQLKAVKNGEVYLTDGNQYFNRPGPRLVESYDILTEIIHRKEPDPARLAAGWEKFRP